MGTLLESLLEKAKSLGPEFESAIHESLRVKNPEYERGAHMTVREANALVPGDVVWVTYQEYGQRGYRIDSAETLESISEPGDFNLSCGGFYYDPDKDMGLQATSDNEGEMRLYHAVKK